MAGTERDADLHDCPTHGAQGLVHDATLCPSCAGHHASSRLFPLRRSGKETSKGTPILGSLRDSIGGWIDRRPIAVYHRDIQEVET